MAGSQDDLFGAEGAGEGDELERLSGELFERVSSFAQEREIADEMLSLLLLDLIVRSRMVSYALSVEKPSVSGLKLDLDRFRREVDEALRAAKKDADTFIATARDAVASAEPEAGGAPPGGVA